MNAAICSHDAVVFADQLLDWLAATSFIRVLPGMKKLGLQPDVIPALSRLDLREEAIRKEADDTVMAFCIAAGLHRDAVGFAKLDTLLMQRFGPLYPGSSALYHCNQVIDPIVTLDDAVGQVLKALFERQDFSPEDLWNAGLRLLQRSRSSNFQKELTVLLAQWLRAQWSGLLAGAGRAELVQPEVNIPEIELALADPIDDEAFIAAVLFASADATGKEIDPAYRSQLAALARRSPAGR
jgi:hypothetical protein